MRVIFPGNVIALGGGYYKWSLSSPDLTPTDCFSSLNSKVYQHRPQTLEALEKMITLGI